MMSRDAHHFLCMILNNRTIERPRLASHTFMKEGFAAQLLECHLIAMQIAMETGSQPVPGIAFLDFYGKLAPWPHMVNLARDGSLIDYSPPTEFDTLGFVRMSFDEWPYWMEVMRAHMADNPANIDKPRWDDPLAHALHVEFYDRLKA